MVLTDLPFEHGALIHSRYTTIRRPDSAPAGIKEDEERRQRQTKSYATFLREQERKVGPEGFLDSSRYSHSFVVKKDKSKQKLRKSADSGIPSRPSVVAFSARVEKDGKDHKKRMKVIEDHMWQHKQEERELKRVEGDIIKNQRAVRHTLRDFENAINKKRMQEEKKLNQGLEVYTKIRRDFVHKKEDLTKTRIQHTMSTEHNTKWQGRKNEVQQSDLSRKYRSKVSELELKRIEVLRMNQDFETKMRQTEEEQLNLQNELAELSINLNMESQKGRVMRFESERERKKNQTNKIQENLQGVDNVKNKLMRSDGDTKAAEMNKRKLSADLSLTKSHLDIKKRDEQRHLTDTQFRLDDNSNIQRQLNEAAFHANLDMKARQIDQKLEAHNARRINKLVSTMSDKKMKEDEKQAVWESRFKRRYNEHKRKEHDDQLKFFQKMVVKGDDCEQSLYNKVRNSEYTRQKQEQTVRRLQQTLADVKRKNSVKIRQELSERQREEKELQEKLIREKAELDKAHAQREESYIKLQQHRQLLKEDKHNLKEHERENARILKISERSDTALTETY
ncbi:trichohyalin-like [Mizuhopecten yessoensis]|uniref:trichohyalin-like n=1 Tax=Mizuhopecten yessoensis TaxID=6573 RepID=UPI000B458BC9|nr:trichohyalin-like [Mizuhopecten yessoensis]XP_021343097.1 trichohyalin-like [Mizuhopecten yessoensis]